MAGFLSLCILFIDIIAAICTILGISIKDTNTDISPFLSFMKSWGCWILILLLVILILRILWIASKLLIEKEFVANAAYTPIKLLNDLKSLTGDITNLNLNHIDFGEFLVKTCNNLRTIFNNLTNKHCAISIKVIKDNQDNTYCGNVDNLLNKSVRNICRDTAHNDRNTDVYNHTDHKIRENTSFSTIVAHLQKTKNFYINNNVDISNGYVTSSPYTDEHNEPINPPYKSELVFPIHKRENQNQFTFIGFLCIDAEEPDAFKKGNEGFILGQMYSEMLFWIIKNYGEAN